MNKARGLFSGILRLLLAIVLAAQWPASEQNRRPANKPAHPAQPPATQEEPKPIPPTAQPPKEEPPKDEVKITPRQAEELFHSADEILGFERRQNRRRTK